MAVKLTLTVSGSADDYGEEEIASLAASIAALLDGVDAEHVTIEIMPGSVVIVATIELPPETGLQGAEEAEQSLETSLATVEAASSLLGVAVEAVPVVETVVVDADDGASSSGGTLPLAVIVGIAAGAGSVVLLACAFGISRCSVGSTHTSAKVHEATEVDRKNAWS